MRAVSFLSEFVSSPVLRKAVVYSASFCFRRFSTIIYKMKTKFCNALTFCLFIFVA